MDHPDFRVKKKVFASLGYPNEKYGMIKLRPEQQEFFTRDYPNAFAAVKGGWGLRGATQVDLESVDESTLRLAMKVAHQNIASRTAEKS